jgi:hypothetical protein
MLRHATRFHSTVWPDIDSDPFSARPLFPGRVINLPLLQITAQNSYPIQELQAQFQAVIGAAPGSLRPVSARPPRQGAKRITAER